MSNGSHVQQYPMVLMRWSMTIEFGQFRTFGHGPILNLPNWYKHVSSVVDYESGAQMALRPLTAINNDVKNENIRKKH